MRNLSPNSLYNPITKSIGILELVGIFVLFPSSSTTTSKRRDEKKETYLPHVDSNLTTLTYDLRAIFPVHPQGQVRKNLWCCNAPQGFGGFVSNHFRFVNIFQSRDKCWDRMRRQKLTENKGNLVSRKRDMKSYSREKR